MVTKTMIAGTAASLVFAVAMPFAQAAAPERPVIQTLPAKPERPVLTAPERPKPPTDTRPMTRPAIGARPVGPDLRPQQLPVRPEQLPLRPMQPIVRPEPPRAVQLPVLPLRP